MGRLSRTWKLLGACGVLLLGSGAYALASPGSNTITVCVKQNGGTLYRATKCAKHDTKLRWNKQGPAGASGQQGAQGVQGIQGAQGIQGVQGVAGPTTTVAPSGSTQQGTIYIDGYSGSTELGTSLSFPLHLASAPVLDEVNSGSTDAHCQGTAAAPTAAPGYLCIYIVQTYHVTVPLDGFAFWPQAPGALSGGGISTFGVDLYVTASASGQQVLAQATWL